MKIKAVDNFGRETVSDWLVCENVNAHMGAQIVRLLNESEGERSSYCYELVSDDHVLYSWEP